jgi:hypothetical protein
LSQLRRAGRFYWENPRHLLVLPAAVSLARFSVPIYGTKRSGDLQVSGSWRKGIWDLSVDVIYEEDGEEQTIRITQQVK